MGETRQFCTLFVDDLLFGVEVEKVQEILRHTEMTRVPLAPRVVRGLINLRGQIVTAVDLRRRLELSEQKGEFQPVSLVVRVADRVFSLLVDAIGDVMEVEAAIYEHPPETLRGAAREYIRGAYKLPDRLLLVLDTEKAVRLGSLTGPSTVAV